MGTDGLDTFATLFAYGEGEASSTTTVVVEK